MSLFLPSLVLSVLGCTPQSAALDEGEFIAFLADSSSQLVANGAVDLEGEPISGAFDCQNEPTIFGADEICDQTGFPPRNEIWARRDGFHIMGGPIEAWRGEAIITNEYDYQVTFHHRLPGGEDFRFAFVVDPDFQPKRCELIDGVPTSVDIHGPWVENWSADTDEEGDKLFFLNAFSYQFNPSNTENFWSLPQEWAAGFADARFGGEELTLRTARYGEPDAYLNFDLEEDTAAVTAADLFYVASEAGTDPTTSAGFSAMRSRVDNIVTRSIDEVTLLASAADSTFAFEPLAHHNLWRTPDGSEAGLDGWMEIHYNWVRFDAGSDLTEGGASSGEFHLMFEGLNSQSRILMRGRFTVDKAKADRWTTRNLPEEKREENGTVVCGE